MDYVDEVIDLNFDTVRYRLWTDAFSTVQLAGQPVTHKHNSHWLWVVEVVRGLARLDARLVVEDRWASSLFRQESWLETDQDRYADHVTMSQLWVLGSYELLRTFIEKFKEREKSEKKIHEDSQRKIKTRNRIQGQKKIQISAFKRDPILLRAEELLKDFERLRMPMAKLKVAKSFKLDNTIARPALSECGVGWTTAAEIFISRVELADKMIAMFSGYTLEEMEERFQALNLLVSVCRKP